MRIDLFAIINTTGTVAGTQRVSVRNLFPPFTIQIGEWMRP